MPARTWWQAVQLGEFEFSSHPEWRVRAIDKMKNSTSLSWVLWLSALQKEISFLFIMSVLRCWIKRTTTKKKPGTKSGEQNRGKHSRYYVFWCNFPPLSLLLPFLTATFYFSDFSYCFHLSSSPYSLSPTSPWQGTKSKMCETKLMLNCFYLAEEGLKRLMFF